MVWVDPLSNKALSVITLDCLTVCPYHVVFEINFREGGRIEGVHFPLHPVQFLKFLKYINPILGGAAFTFLIPEASAFMARTPGLFVFLSLAQLT